MKFIKTPFFRIITALFLTFLLSGISRKLSTRNPKDIHFNLGDIAVEHTTVTECKPDRIATVRVKLNSDDLVNVNGFLYYKFLSGEEKKIVMEYSDDGYFSAVLPEGDIGDKLFYRIELANKRSVLVTIPQNSPAGILVKYKGNVSPYVLIPHIILIFTSIFIAFLTFFYGVKILKGDDCVRQAGVLVLLTFLFALVGGILIGVEVTRQTFNEGFGGYPIGRDVTDTKTEIFVFFWLVTLIFGWNALRGKQMIISDKAFGILIVISFSINLLAFLIPHSL
jgi:hypothetical protein